MPVETNLTFANIAALAGVMIVGAMAPSISVLAVATRSAALGFSHGVITAAGIVAGDIVFILIAIYGLSVLADLLGSHFVWIKYLGGAYLIWLGVMLWRSTPRADGVEENGKRSMPSSFLTGLLITLADQKAILFYLGFFPAFVDLSSLSAADVGIILIVAIVAVGAPKLLYALLARKAGLMLRSSRATRAVNKAAGGLLAGIGVFLMVTA